MKILFTEQARKNWQRLDTSIRKQLQKKLDFYLNSGQPLQFAEHLKDPVLGDFRFRIGDWRIIFDVGKDEIIVLRVGHRKDIYK